MFYRSKGKGGVSTPPFPLLLKVSRWMSQKSPLPHLAPGFQHSSYQLFQGMLPSPPMQFLPLIYR
jgi:hypothetical protein